MAANPDQSVVNVQYRSPRRDEAAVLGAFGQKTFCDSFAYIYAPNDLAMFLEQAYSVDAIDAELNNPLRRYYIAEQDGALVGYAKIGYAGADGEISLDYPANGKIQMELKQLYIGAEHQGLGVAQKLMEWVLSAAEECAADEIILSVYSENPRAQHFYKKYGFAYAADTIFRVGNHIDHEFIFIKAMK